MVACSNSGDMRNGLPKTLIIGIYSGDNPTQTKEKIAPFQKYLEKELGMPVTFFFSSDYTSLVEGMQRKKLHIAQLSPFAYVLATQKPCLVPIAAFGINHQPTTYHSIIFVNSKSAIHSLEDVRKQSKNLTLCFADPASASGHLVPRAYLKGIGLDPESSFKQVVFAGSHAASIMSINSGKIDIGCSTNDLALDKMVREGTVNAADFRILWESDPIVNDAITARSDLNKDFIAKVQKAYLEVDQKDSIAFKGSFFRYYPNPVNMQFIPIADSVYNPIRKIAYSIKELKLIN